MDTFEDGGADENFIMDDTRTYMSHLCVKILPKSVHADDTYNGISSCCLKWFKNATEHCREIVFTLKKSKFWPEVLNFNFLFPKSESSLLNPKPHMAIHPNNLRTEECHYLLQEITADYLETIPKLSNLVEENIFLDAVVKTMLGLLLLFVMYSICRRISRRSLKRDRILESHCTKAAPQDLRNHLRDHLSEVRALKVDKVSSLPLRFESGIPTISMRVTKRKFTDSMAWFVKSDGVHQKYCQGELTKSATLNHNQTAFKLKSLLSKSSKCRLLIEVDFNDSSSDTDTDDREEFHSYSEFKDSMTLRSTVPYRHPIKDRKLQKVRYRANGQFGYEASTFPSRRSSKIHILKARSGMT